jgi:hypothetical protein
MGRLLESCEDTWRRRRRGFMWARQLSHYNLYIYHTREDTLKSIVLLILCYTDLHSSPAISITVFCTLFTLSRILRFTSPAFVRISIVFCDHVELREHQGLSCPEDRGDQANGSAESWRGSAGNQGKMPCLAAICRPQPGFWSSHWFLDEDR